MTRTSPTTTVLGSRTTPDYHQRTTETGVTTIKAGLLVHKSTAAGADNDVNLCDAQYGNAIGTEESIEIVEVQSTAIELPLQYDFTNAYPATTGIVTHKIHLRDEIWVKTSGTIAATDEDDILECQANGLVGLPVATTTVDSYNVHAFKPVGPNAANVTWILAEYVGIRAIDAA